MKTLRWSAAGTMECKARIEYLEVPNTLWASNWSFSRDISSQPAHTALHLPATGDLSSFHTGSAGQGIEGMPWQKGQDPIASNDDQEVICGTF